MYNVRRFSGFGADTSDYCSSEAGSVDPACGAGTGTRQPETSVSTGGGSSMPLLTVSPRGMNKGAIVSLAVGAAAVLAGFVYVVSK